MKSLKNRQRPSITLF